MSCRVTECWFIIIILFSEKKNQTVPEFFFPSEDQSLDSVMATENIKTR